MCTVSKSSLNAVKALKAADADVKGMIAIFSYGFTIALENFNAANVQLHTLSNYESLLKEALQTNFITDTQLNILSSWNDNPAEWTTN